MLSKGWDAALAPVRRCEYIFAIWLRLLAFPAIGSSSRVVLGREETNEKGRERQGPDPAGDRKGTPLLETAAVSQHGRVGKGLHVHGEMEPSTGFSSGTIRDEEPTIGTFGTGVFAGWLDVSDWETLG